MEEIYKRLENLERLLVIQTREVLDTKEAAILLGVTEGRVRQLASKHKIPYYKKEDGKQIYFKKSELENSFLGKRFPSEAELKKDPLKFINQQQL